jgi:hypothetical protein
MIHWGIPWKMIRHSMSARHNLAAREQEIYECRNVALRLKPVGDGMKWYE